MSNSAKSIYIAKEASKNKWEEQREERAIKVYDYIESYPNQTAYSLKKRFNYPLRTIQTLINSLEEEKLIKMDQIVENGRVKKVVQVTEVTDQIYDTFNKEIANDPVIKELIERTIAKGHSVFIHDNNGSKIELKP